MASPVIVITRTVIPIYSSVFIGTRISVMEWLSACLTVVCAVVVSETSCEKCLMEVMFGHEASEQVSVHGCIQANCERLLRVQQIQLYDSWCARPRSLAGCMLSFTATAILAIRDVMYARVEWSMNIHACWCSCWHPKCSILVIIILQHLQPVSLALFLPGDVLMSVFVVTRSLFLSLEIIP